MGAFESSSKEDWGQMRSVVHAPFFLSALVILFCCLVPTAAAASCVEKDVAELGM